MSNIEKNEKSSDSFSASEQKNDEASFGTALNIRKLPPQGASRVAMQGCTCPCDC